jgi:hypothetical protein
MRALCRCGSANPLTLMHLGAPSQQLTWEVSDTMRQATALSPEQQPAVIARNARIETSLIPALRLHVIQVASNQLDATLRSPGSPQELRAKRSRGPPIFAGTFPEHRNKSPRTW